jgi:hypothetical protein
LLKVVVEVVRQSWPVFLRLVVGVVEIRKMLTKFIKKLKADS